MPTIQIDQSTFERLQRNAIAFVETTPQPVIIRALDALEAAQRTASPHPSPSDQSAAFAYTDRNLPNLTHTKVTAAFVNGRELPHPNWNSLLDEVLIVAVKKGLSVSEIRAVGGVNVIEKKKSDEGFHFLDGTGISVQGQDSNRACYGALALSRKLGIRTEVRFLWRDKEGAAHPGSSGTASSF